MTYSPDDLIERTLVGLRDVKPPADLERRIACRLMTAPINRSTKHNSLPGFLNAVAKTRAGVASVTLSAAVVTCVLLALLFQKPRMMTQASAITKPTPPPALTQTASRHIWCGTTVIRVVSHHRSSNVPSYALPQDVPDSPDLDALALAETSAPSHPAPPMPVSKEEALLVDAARLGQSVELAEFSLGRGRAFRTAINDHDTLRSYFQGVLAPLTVAQALTSAASP